MYVNWQIQIAVSSNNQESSEGDLPRFYHQVVFVEHKALDSQHYCRQSGLLFSQALRDRRACGLIP
jgi:hypothetical protein